MSEPDGTNPSGPEINGLEISRLGMVFASAR